MRTVYEIGPLRLDPEVGVLTKAGVPLPLGARGVAVLGALVEHANEYVSKAAIIDVAWPGVVVEDSNLAVQILAIRRALARVPGGEHWIETLSRRGYRFVGPAVAVRDQTPAEAAIGAERTNLPEPLTSFVGRERELLEIRRLLRTARLVTLVGIGGIGKTRLALQVAAELLDAYRDGVRLADFAALDDPALVATTVAQTLGVHDRAGTSHVEGLRSHLRRRQLLLVFDGCDHVLSECALLAEALLRDGVETTIIATSREPLGLAGEQLYALSPLSLPEAGATAETIAKADAVQLFIERALRQQPGFTVNAARAQVIAALCVHLDGIPLAIELAAARVRSLSVEQILARIDDRFRLLTKGSVTSLPRQQTLRATMDWSFDLLAEDERTVLRRLAIFAGGFTLEAAAAVAADPGLDDNAVIDVLSRLVTRSLVNADTGTADVRYRLLETTRAYALEKLVEALEAPALALRHARYVRDYFEQGTADWWRLSDESWRTRYCTELDNVRAALGWSLGAPGDAAVGIALAGASGPLWMELSLIREGRRWLEQAAARVDVRSDIADEARLWCALGSLWEAAPMQALPVCERAVGLYRGLADPLGLGVALTQLGASLTYLGRHEAAASAFAEAHSRLSPSAPPRALADYFLQSGALKALSSDLAGARSHYENALSLYRGAGADRMTLIALMYVADMIWMSGDLDAAQAAFREPAALARKSPLRRLTLGFCLVNLAGIHAERGDLDEARARMDEGMPILREAGQTWLLADHIALLLAREGNAASGARIAGYADAAHMARSATRQANERRARDHAQRLLSAELAPEAMEQLLAAGATLTDDEASAVALEH
jgi:predicted ATPase/DNA-binding winged helix-turn-helix (wHTH) protein